MKKILITTGLFVFFACTKKECFAPSSQEDLYYLQEIKKLFTYQYLSGVWLQDTATQSWSLWIKTPNLFFYTSENDDCGNKRATYSYQTSFLQKNGTNFHLKFSGDDNQKRYLLHFFIEDSLNGIRQQVSYDLRARGTLSDTTQAEVLENYDFDGKTYEKVFKFRFTNLLPGDAVKTFYYTGYDGLLGFEKANGKVFR